MIFFHFLGQNVQNNGKVLQQLTKQCFHVMKNKIRVVLSGVTYKGMWVTYKGMRLLGDFKYYQKNAE